VSTATLGLGGRRFVDHVLPPLVFGVAFLLLWEAVVKGFDLKPYFLVAPSQIFDKFVDNWTLVWRSMKVSGGNALVGLIVGTVLGVLVSLVNSRYRVLRELVTPLAIALNAIPIFVLVSVFNNMFAITSEVPRRLMVTLVVYFVVLVNVTRGLTQVHTLHLELMRSYAASGVSVLRLLRVPNAVPYLFTALKVAAPLAVITAFVSEYFGGSQNGLGSAIARSIAASRNDLAWAYVFGACILGLTFYLISILLESVATPGGFARRGGGTS
jgi:NitT/TauT family transport system permease protein